MVNTPKVASLVPISPITRSVERANTETGLAASPISHRHMSRLWVPETTIGVRKRRSWVSLTSPVGAIRFMKARVTAAVYVADLAGRDALLGDQETPPEALGVTDHRIQPRLFRLPPPKTAADSLASVARGFSISIFAPRSTAARVGSTWLQVEGRNDHRINLRPGRSIRENPS